MEQEIVDLGREIDRQERIDAMEREMNAPTATPLTAKPDNNKKDTKAGRASDSLQGSILEPGSCQGWCILQGS